MPSKTPKVGCSNGHKDEWRANMENIIVYAFALIQFCTTLPSGGFGAYASIIIKSFGFTTWQTQLLQMPTGVVMICVMLTSVWADRKFKQTILIMMVGVLPTIAGTVALISVPFEPSKRVGLLIAYYAMYSFWVCSGLALSLVSRNVAGQTKKTAVIASNFVFWAMGNSIGPQCFRDKDKPRYFMALSIVLGCFILLEVVLIVLRTYYVWMNKRRDAMVASGEVVADVDFAHSFEDITDNVSYSHASPAADADLVDIAKSALQVFLLIPVCRTSFRCGYWAAISQSYIVGDENTQTHHSC